MRQWACEIDRRRLYRLEPLARVGRRGLTRGASAPAAAHAPTRRGRASRHSGATLGPRAEMMHLDMTSPAHQLNDVRSLEHVKEGAWPWRFAPMSGPITVDVMEDQRHSNPAPLTRAAS